MPIKKVSIEHSLRKGFLWKSLEYYLKQAENSVQGVPNIVHSKIKLYENLSKIFAL